MFMYVFSLIANDGAAVRQCSVRFPANVVPHIPFYGEKVSYTCKSGEEISGIVEERLHLFEEQPDITNPVVFGFLFRLKYVSPTELMGLREEDESKREIQKVVPFPGMRPK